MGRIATVLLAAGIALAVAGGALAQNVVCVSDTTLLNVANPTRTVDVDYLGGGSGLLYGFSILFSWDGSVAATTTPQVTEGNLLSDLGTTWFEVHLIGSDSIIVDCVLLGGQSGVSGPGTMFTIEFDGAAYGESPLDLTIESVRDSMNGELSGFAEDDGLLVANLNAPTVSLVEITDATIASTTWCKDGDAMVIIATVNDPDDVSGDLVTVTANLNGFYGGAGHGADPPSSGSYPTYTWTVPAGPVVCSPSNGTVQVDIDVVDAGGNTGTGFDTITSDNTPPDPVVDLDATPHFHRVHLVWSVPSDSWGVLEGIEIHRVRWNDYPEYAMPEPSYPATPGTGEADYLASVASPGTGYDDTLPNDFASRDIYYYTVWSRDEAGNYGAAPAGAEDRATDYWLGDVTSSGGGYDGYVDFFDVNALSAAYRMYDITNPPPPPHNELDIALTDDGSARGIPVPDDDINFEELMIVAINFNTVSPTLKGGPEISAAAASGRPRLCLELSGGAESATELVAGLRLEDGTGVAGASVLISFDPERIEWVETSPGASLGNGDAPVFFRSGFEGRGEVWIDLAALGNGATIGGSERLATLRFRILDEGDPQVRIAEANLRNRANERIELSIDERLQNDVGTTPGITRFGGAWPNPFNPATTVRFQLREPERVLLSVFDARGRCVRTLVDGNRDAGEHEAVWDGRDQRGKQVGSGVYLVHMRAGAYRYASKIVMLK